MICHIDLHGHGFPVGNDERIIYLSFTEEQKKILLPYKSVGRNAINRVFSMLHNKLNLVYSIGVHDNVMSKVYFS